MNGDFVLYGAYGYTGELVARMSAEHGLRPLLAGRDETKLAELGERLGFVHRAVSLDDPTGLDSLLAEAPLVLHCAGPFSRTWRAMSDACLRTRTHYLDVTGEIAVFESLAARDGEARSAGVMLLPGVGFDVVPTDCLAAHLSGRLHGATHLSLAFEGSGRVSRGTATTMVENAGGGGAVRRDGRIVSVPAAYLTRTVDFGEGPREAATIPWGDVSTAYHSTGIPNIEVFLAAPPARIRSMKALRHFGWLVRSAPVQALLKRSIRRAPAGPSDEQRARGRSLVWGEARDSTGRRVEARLSGPEGYTLTAIAALMIARRVLNGTVEPGFMTPSRLLGADFVLEIPGVQRVDVT